MQDRYRIRLSEGDAMERGIRCPNCGTYTSFGDILATGQCRGRWADECETQLSLDLVIGGYERAEVDIDDGVGVDVESS